MSRTPLPREGTEDLVRRLVTDVLGSPVVGLARMDFGHVSVTYDVEVAGGHVIVRTNADPSAYAGTIANLRALERLGIPVPKVVHHDLSLSRWPFACMVTERFPGRDLRFELESMTPGQITALAGRIVGFQKSVGALPRGLGYGFVPLGGTGAHPTWFAVVEAEMARSSPAAQPDVRALTARVRSALEARRAELEALPAVCFLDDLTTKNVIVDRGNLTGVVDFDVVCYGDPLYWIALTSVAILSDIGPHRMSYADELARMWGVDAAGRRRLDLYRACHAVHFLEFADGDLNRRDRLISEANTWLTATGDPSTPNS